MKRLLIAACFVAFLAAPAALADNWPQWRGPKNDGHSAEKGIPTEWGPDKNVVWKLKMPGIGASTPCVWGDRIFLTVVRRRRRRPALRRHRRQGEVEAAALEHRSKALPQPLGR